MSSMLSDICDVCVKNPSTNGKFFFTNKCTASECLQPYMALRQHFFFFRNISFIEIDQPTKSNSKQKNIHFGLIQTQEMD